jgi:ribosomal protein RSM22 (predicted rRNA methylase)
MRLPSGLRHAIQRQIDNADRSDLGHAVAQLTQRYKAGSWSGPAITTGLHRTAYLAVRMPATFAANMHVLAEIHRLAPEIAIAGLLDLGAGPGTSAYAAAEVFQSLSQVALVDADRSFIELGRKLSQDNALAAIRDAKWLQQDLKTGVSPALHDLVVISYTLNELSRMDAEKMVLEAWECSREFLAIVEPGTMRGFGVIHAARAQLLARGAHILAPCPHAHECPMAAASDWCHFAQRVERTSDHRRLKGGALGYEDEKFSYVVASRRLLPAAEARIVRHPQKHSGHVQLRLCTLHGLEKRTIGRSQKESYKRARKAEWGDGWE